MSLSTGLTLPTSGVSGVPISGTTVWTNPGNITLDDGSLATVTVGAGTTSKWLNGGTFGIVCPDYWSIVGVEVQLDISTNTSAVSQVTLYNGSNLGVLKNISGLSGIATIGSPGDTWSLNLDKTIVNSIQFSVVARVFADATGGTLALDAMWVNVYAEDQRNSPIPIAGRGASW